MVRPKVIDAKPNQNNQRSSFVKMDRFVDAERSGVRSHKWANQNVLFVGISMKCEIVKQNKLRRKLCFVVSRHATSENMRESSQETDIPI
jgi:hypothetical protein